MLSERADRRYNDVPVPRHQPHCVPTDMMTKSIFLGLAAVVLSALPGVAVGQSAGASAYIDDRLAQISRSIAGLRSQAEQLQKQTQQLQQQLDKMRSCYESRLERLEKGKPAKAPPRRSAQPHR